MFSVQTSRA